jgi:hypothetical protein
MPVSRHEAQAAQTPLSQDAPHQALWPAATLRYYAEDDTRAAVSGDLRRLAPAATWLAAPFSTNSCFGVTINFLVTRDQVEVVEQHVRARFRVG